MQDTISLQFLSRGGKNQTMVVFWVFKSCGVVCSNGFQEHTASIFGITELVQVEAAVAGGRKFSLCR
jgi:hypothetical protein